MNLSTVDEREPVKDVKMFFAKKQEAFRSVEALEIKAKASNNQGFSFTT